MTPEKVKDSPTINKGLEQFETWLEKTLKKYDAEMYNNDNVQHKETVKSFKKPNVKLAAFLTWSDWDLGTCLLDECKRKKLQRPVHFNSWINLKKLYNDHYRSPPKNLQDAMKLVDLEFQGMAHSGIVDSRNTAVLAMEMMRNDCRLKITRVINHSGQVIHIKPPASSMAGILSRIKTENEIGPPV